MNSYRRLMNKIHEGLVFVLIQQNSLSWNINLIFTSSANYHMLECIIKSLQFQGQRTRNNCKTLCNISTSMTNFQCYTLKNENCCKRKTQKLNYLMGLWLWFLVTLRLKMGMPDSQPYNLHLINDVEDIVVFFLESVTLEKIPQLFCSKNALVILFLHN